MASSSSIFSSATSPFDNNVTFKHIMEFVGTDYRSLLQCRLVAHSWNEMSLTVLNKNGTKLKIGGDRAPWKIRSADADFHNSLKYLQEMSKRSDNETRLVPAFDKLPVAYYAKPKEAEIVNYLLRPVLPVPPVITSITYQTSSLLSLLDSTFWEAVRATAPNLRAFKLDLVFRSQLNQDFQVVVPSSEYDLLLGSAQFPKLSNVQIEYSEEMKRRLNTLPGQIAGLSPNMKKFRCVPSQHECSFTAGRECSTKALLGKLLPPEIYATIHNLEVRLPFLAKFTPELFPSFRRLQHLQLAVGLKLNDVTSRKFANGVTEFLKRNPVTSLSLDLTLFRSPHVGVQILLQAANGQYWLIEPPAPVPAPAPNIGPLFPVLPCLVHLGIYATCRLAVDLKFLRNFFKSVAVNCTGLKSLSFDQSMYWTLIPHPEEEEQDQEPAPAPWYLEGRKVVFELVETFLLATRNNTITSHKEFQEIATMTNALFPRLNEMIIDNTTERKHFEHNIVPGLMGVQGIKILGFKTIEKLCLTNGDLGSKLMNSELAESVERLEMKMLEHDGDQRKTPRPSPLLHGDLKNLLKTFRNLTVFEIDWKLLSGQMYGCTDFEEELREMEILKTEFPKVDIRVT